MNFVFRDITDEGAAIGKNLFSGDFEMPRLVLRRSALEHNITAMKDFCAVHGVSIAPHAKTTMAPAIVRRQLEAGAWGVTVATSHQLRACAEMGAPRILMAYQLVNPRASEWLGRLLSERQGGLEVYVIVDSEEGVELLAQGLKASGLSSPLPVLVEMGASGGRTGCRTVAEAVTVAQAVDRCGALRLAGVEGFEGILGSRRSPDDLARVDAFLLTMVDLAGRLVDGGLFGEGEPMILSAGGSTFFDRVAAVLGSARLGLPSTVVLRSGCYVTHDHASDVGPAPMVDEHQHEQLVPALELWSEVLSTPEPGRAIVGFGRRDAPFDAGLPVVVSTLGVGAIGRPTKLDGTVTALNDQHAYLDLADGHGPEVGDRIGCGIRHPCTAFDKWRKIPMVDDDYNVVEVVHTLF